MSAGHRHGGIAGHEEPATAGARHRRALLAAFCLTLAYMVAEVAGGLATGSLALLSDAAHMATDALGLGMALAAVHLASRPASSQRTWGTYRLEVLAALANGVLLFVVAGGILVDAWHRFSAPPDVAGVAVLAVAGAGLAVNLVCFRVLAAGSSESLNVRVAYVDVLSDAFGSLAVLVAAAVIALTGWTYADPLVATAIGLFLLPRTWQLCAQAIRIVMEIAPPHVDVADVEQRLVELPGVAGVHALHLWTLTSGVDAASCHVVVAEGADAHGVLDSVGDLLRDQYGVAHSTIQCETADHRDAGIWRPAR